MKILLLLVCMQILASCSLNKSRADMNDDGHLHIIEANKTINDLLKDVYSNETIESLNLQKIHLVDLLGVWKFQGPPEDEGDEFEDRRIVIRKGHAYEYQYPYEVADYDKYGEYMILEKKLCLEMHHSFDNFIILKNDQFYILGYRANQSISRLVRVK